MRYAGDEFIVVLSGCTAEDGEARRHDGAARGGRSSDVSRQGRTPRPLAETARASAVGFPPPLTSLHATPSHHDQSPEASTPRYVGRATPHLFRIDSRTQWIRRASSACGVVGVHWRRLGRLSAIGRTAGLPAAAADRSGHAAVERLALSILLGHTCRRSQAICRLGPFSPVGICKVPSRYMPRERP